MYVFAYLRFNLKKKQDFVMRLSIKAQIRTQKNVKCVHIINCAKLRALCQKCAFCMWGTTMDYWLEQLVLQLVQTYQSISFCLDQLTKLCLVLRAIHENVFLYSRMTVDVGL